MMYFTETGEVPEDPIALNEEFEKQFDTDEFEEKISKLLQHVYKRLSGESEGKRKTWDAAVACLKRGDHYILVMWDTGSGGLAKGSSVGSSAYILGGSIVATVFALMWGLRWIASHFPPPNPPVIWGVLAALVVGGALFRKQLATAGEWFLV
jgi:hypothetical protein